jgi:hypothetical protein
MAATTTADPTVSFLLRRGWDFRDKVDVLKIKQQLRSTNPEDRCDSALFSVYHLLFSAAVAEANIEDYVEESPLPELVSSRIDEWDLPITIEAWQGKSFGNARNIIGRLSFIVVLLFFFEGFSKLVAGGEATIRAELGKKGMVGLSKVIDWLRGEVPAASVGKLDTVDFLNKYRNAWHSFGYYTGATPVTCHGVTIQPGAALPPIAPLASLNMLGDLLDLFLVVNDLRGSKPHRAPKGLKP